MIHGNGNEWWWHIAGCYPEPGNPGDRWSGQTFPTKEAAEVDLRKHLPARFLSENSNDR